MMLAQAGLPEPSERKHSTTADQRQKSLNRVVLNCVYRVVWVIETCPSQSWIARVSTPSLASL